MPQFNVDTTALARERAQERRTATSARSATMTHTDARPGRLLARRQDLLDRRKAVVEQAETEEREQFTESETTEFRDLTEQIKQTDERLAELTEEAQRGQRPTAGAQAVAAAQHRSGHGGSTALPSPADIGSEQLRGMFDAVRSGHPYRIETRDIVGGGDPLAVSPRISPAAYVDIPRVANLFTVERTEAGTVRVYAASTAATAGTVAEGAVKPLSGLALTPQDVDMVKVAVRERMSYELTQDLPTFVQQITRELTRSVLAEENNSLTATLLGAPLTAQASTGDVGLDSTATAISSLQALGIQPDAIVMSPGRLAAIRQSVATGSGEYHVSPLTAGPPALHGLPITVTSELVDNTLLVGAFREAGVVYVREPVSVRSGLDGSDFSENMISVVAEERLGLGVTQPGRVVNIDVT